MTQEEFDKSQQRLMSAWHRGDTRDALAEIEAMLREGTPEMKGQCLFYRGEIHKSLSDLASAKEDWLAGLQYAIEGSFLRSQLEHSIGTAYEQWEMPEEALKWYVTALRTCSAGGEFSGNRTLAAYIRLTRGQIPIAETPLVGSVVQKSWRVLGLPGKPDLDDLAGSIASLTQAFEESVSSITNHS